VAEAELAGADDRTIRFKRLRFVPASPARLSYRVEEGDRPDLAAYRTIGDPEQYWRLCDANLVLRPADLTARPGRRILVPGPGG